MVEGSAVDALPIMNSIIENRPTDFTDEKEAIDWFIQSRTIINKHSARMSVPSMI